MGEVLDIVPLRTFVAISDCGGFGRAASALHLSQPTVSQHVRLLEKRLGRTLVEKSGRRAKFTVAGERLLIEARLILSAHDDALQRLDVDSKPVIVIGSTETAADQILPELLGTIRDAYPERTIQFHIDRSTQMTEAVEKGNIDLAIILSIGSDGPGVEVGTLPLNWYSSPSWSPPTGHEAWHLVGYVEPCGMRQRGFERLSTLGRGVQVTAESTSLEGVIAAARAGLGVAVLPSAGRTPDGLILQSALPDLGRISVRLFTRKGLEPSIQRIAFAALEAFFAKASDLDALSA
ncbi:MAG TPA: LysR family transcriptional regulator [Pseudolysinimonas sp.]|nr:LysR family transcriptional regulator [Pseudolysinimonas sp.]